MDCFCNHIYEYLYLQLTSASDNKMVLANMISKCYHSLKNSNIELIRVKAQTNTFSPVKVYPIYLGIFQPKASQCCGILENSLICTVSDDTMLTDPRWRTRPRVWSCRNWHRHVHIYGFYHLCIPTFSIVPWLFNIC